MIVKLMGPEDAPDTDTRKTYRILDGVTAVNFRRDDAGAVVDLTFGSDEVQSFELSGNVYLLSDGGSIISSFGVASLPASDVVGPGRRNIAA